MRHTTLSHDEPRPTLDKNNRPSDYQRILDSQIHRRRTFSGRKSPSLNPSASNRLTNHNQSRDQNPSQAHNTPQAPPQNYTSVTLHNHGTNNNNNNNNNKLKEIPVLKNYQHDKLDLSYNSIRKIQNLDTLRQQLRVLNLSGNCIVKVENIFMLRQLEELNLSHNLIQDLPREMVNLKNLRKLYMNNNKMASLDSLQNIKPLFLTHLTLDNNYFCNLPDFKKFIAAWFRQLAKRAQQMEKKTQQEQASSQSRSRPQSALQTSSVASNSNHQSLVVKEEKKSPNNVTHKVQIPHIKLEEKQDKLLLPNNESQIKPPKTTRNTSQTQIMSYREYLKKRDTSHDHSSNSILNSTQKIELRADNQRRRLGQNRNRINTVVSQKREGLQHLALQVAEVINDLRDLVEGDRPMLQQMRAYLEDTTVSGQYIKVFQKILSLVAAIDTSVIPYNQRLQDLLDSLTQSKQPSNNTVSLKYFYEGLQRQSKQLGEQLNFISLELMNGESELFLKGENKKSLPAHTREYRSRIRIYVKQFNKLQKTLSGISLEIKEFLSQWCYFVELESLAGLAASPSKDHSQLKRLLNSALESSDVKREREVLGQEIRVINQKLSLEQQRCKSLQQDLQRAENENRQLRQSISDLRVDFEEKISQILEERDRVQQKWESMELFNRATDQLYNTIFERQTTITSIMKEKLSMDFFQQILLNQTLTIEDLLKANQQAEALYLQVVSKERNEQKQSRLIKHECSERTKCYQQYSSTHLTNSYLGTRKIGNSSEQIHGSGESPIFDEDLSKERPSYGGKNPHLLNRNPVSEFNIHYDHQMKGQGQNKQQAPRHTNQFFRKSSSGFSFKKSGETNNNNNNNNPHLRSNSSGSLKKSRVSTEKKYPERSLSQQKHQQKVNIANEQKGSESNLNKATVISRGSKKLIVSYTPSIGGVRDISDQNKQNIPANTLQNRMDQSIDTHKHSQYQFQEGTAEQAQSYKNYLKYYLRNNIAEILEKSEQHPNLKGKWGKEEIKHHKYHTYVGPKLINKQR